MKKKSREESKAYRPPDPPVMLPLLNEASSKLEEETFAAGIDVGASDDFEKFLYCSDLEELMSKGLSITISLEYDCLVMDSVRENQEREGRHPL